MGWRAARNRRDYRASSKDGAAAVRMFLYMHHF
jgi:hypothetical protein